ncbi:MAG: hypothetical protein ABSE80_14110, partial [Halobacteriota archaeon]
MKTVTLLLGNSKIHPNVVKLLLLICANGRDVLYWFCELGDAAGICARQVYSSCISPVHPQQAQLTRLWHSRRSHRSNTMNVYQDKQGRSIPITPTV